MGLCSLILPFFQRTEMSTTDQCCVAFATPTGGIDTAGLKQVKDVRPWDSMRSVVLRYWLAENTQLTRLYAILVGRNNSVNLFTVEYYGLYNGLLFHCLTRNSREIGYGKMEMEASMQQYNINGGKSLVDSPPFMFEDLPLDIKQDCLKYLELHNIIRLLQVSKKMKQIASHSKFWENISFYNNNKINKETILSISTAYYAPSIKKLDLSLTQITATVLTEITSKCTSLKELILNSCKELTGGLSNQCSQLEVLSLNGVARFAQPLETIFKANNATLKVLGLAHAYQALTPQLISNCIGLEQIDMNYNRGSVTDAIIEACSHLPNLEVLKMNWCPNGLNENVLRPLTRCTTLKTLEFAEGRCTSEIITALCERNNFKRLHLQEVYTAYSSADIFNNSPELENFYGIIHRGNYKLPKTLKVLMATVTWPELLQRLVDECPLLETLTLLDMSETKLEDHLIALLQAGKLRNIRFLNISGVAGTKALPEIANHCPNLEYLLLTEKTDVTLEQLQMVQQKCSKLREVQVVWRDEYSVLSSKFQGYITHKN